MAFNVRSAYCWLLVLSQRKHPSFFSLDHFRRGVAAGLVGITVFLDTVASLLGYYDPKHRIYHIDLTVVPTGRFWTPWPPSSLAQCWPFAFWVGIVVDHFSRRIMGVTAFKSQPTSAAMRAFLGRTIAKAKAAPRYIVCDRGKQFDCSGFRKWCCYVRTQYRELCWDLAPPLVSPQHTR